MKGTLILKDGTKLEGESFGYEVSTAGEVVFTTGMVGYPEAFTDPSYGGQILIMTYPLIGNYGVANKKTWESDKIQAAGIIVSTYNQTPSHASSEKSLSEWLKEEKIPALEIKDTRLLAQKIRTEGTLLGKIVIDKDVELYDPNADNLVQKVSVSKPYIEGEGKKTVVLFDCGAKRNIVHELSKRNVKVMVVPWDYDVFEKNTAFDAIVISNGPGDPKMADKTIEIVKKALKQNTPILGICLGNQILALAAGGDTYKLKFGHRSQNQPCILEGSDRCYLSTQNHGFAVGKIPKGFKAWFTNANDGTNEGIIHETKPWMSVQFHPESTPGPFDTEWIFDYFLEKAFSSKKN